MHITTHLWLWEKRKEQREKRLKRKKYINSWLVKTSLSNYPITAYSAKVRELRYHCGMLSANIFIVWKLESRSPIIPRRFREIKVTAPRVVLKWLNTWRSLFSFAFQILHNAMEWDSRATTALLALIQPIFLFYWTLSYSGNIHKALSLERERK